MAALTRRRAEAAERALASAAASAQAARQAALRAARAHDAFDLSRSRHERALYAAAIGRRTDVVALEELRDQVAGLAERAEAFRAAAERADDAAKRAEAARDAARTLHAVASRRNQAWGEALDQLAAEARAAAEAIFELEHDAPPVPRMPAP